MGNRAAVFFNHRDADSGVYLHWNGGPESVLAFLKTMLNRGWNRMDYAPARLIGVVVEFFDKDGDCSGLSVGTQLKPSSGDFKDADPGDNGVFVVHDREDGWHVVNDGIEWNLSRPIKFGNPNDQNRFDAIVDILATGRNNRKIFAQKVNNR